MTKRFVSVVMAFLTVLGLAACCGHPEVAAIGAADGSTVFCYDGKVFVEQQEEPQETEINPGLYEYNEDDIVDSARLYKVYYHEFDYYCRIFDLSGDIVYQEGNFREPHLSMVNDYTVLFWVQTGTGASTRWGFMYNAEKDVVSRNFYWIHDAFESLIVYCSYDGEVQSVVVRDAFDETAYYRVFDEFEHPFAPSLQPILSVEFSEDGKRIIVTYMTGENYAEVTEMFELY